jgi:hypothetical protein
MERKRGNVDQISGCKRVVSVVAGTFDHIGLHMSGYCTIENDIYHCGFAIAKLPSLALLRDLPALEPSRALMATLEDPVHLDAPTRLRGGLPPPSYSLCRYDSRSGLLPRLACEN